MAGEGTITLKLKKGDQQKLNIALQELALKADANTPIVLAQAGHVGVSSCKRNCNVGTSGELRASIGNPTKNGIFNLGRNSIIFGTAVNYAIYVENGTKPHVIKPVKAKMLAWQKGAVAQKIKVSSGGISRGALQYRTSGGKLTTTKKQGEWVFAKEVHHPGYIGSHFMLRGVEQAVPAMVKVLSGVLRG